MRFGSRAVGINRSIRRWPHSKTHRLRHVSGVERAHVRDCSSLSIEIFSSVHQKRERSKKENDQYRDTRQSESNRMTLPDTTQQYAQCTSNKREEDQQSAADS